MLERSLTQLLKYIRPSFVEQVKVSLNILDHSAISLQCCHLPTKLDNLFLV